MLGYQILQPSSRTIGSPFLQPKALRNSATPSGCETEETAVALLRP